MKNTYLRIKKIEYFRYNYKTLQKVNRHKLFRTKIKLFHQTVQFTFVVIYSHFILNFLKDYLANLQDDLTPRTVQVYPRILRTPVPFGTPTRLTLWGPEEAASERAEGNVSNSMPCKKKMLCYIKKLFRNKLS